MKRGFLNRKSLAPPARPSGPLSTTKEAPKTSSGDESVNKRDSISLIFNESPKFFASSLSDRFKDPWGFSPLLPRDALASIAISFKDRSVSKMRLERVEIKSSSAGEPGTKCLLYVGGKEALYASMGRSFPQPMYKRSAQLQQLGFPPYRVKQVPNSDMGLGMFAECDIDLGEIITTERALLIVPMVIPAQNTVDLAIEMLTPSEKQSFFSLANCRPHEGSNGIFNTNGFEVEVFPGNYIGVYRGMFKDLSRINHSCTPNVVFHWNLEQFNGFTRACRPIKKGEQIFISYIDSIMSRADRQAQLQSQYYFTCSCPTCTGLSESESAQSDAIRELLSSIEKRCRGPNGEYLMTDFEALDEFILNAIASWDGYSYTPPSMAGSKPNVHATRGSARKSNANPRMKAGVDTAARQKLHRVVHASEFLVSLAEKEGLEYETAMEMVYGRLFQAHGQLDPSSEGSKKAKERVFAFIKVHGP